MKPSYFCYPRVLRVSPVLKKLSSGMKITNRRKTFKVACRSIRLRGSVRFRFQLIGFSVILMIFDITCNLIQLVYNV